MKRSMPTISPMPSTSPGRCDWSPLASTACPNEHPGRALGGDHHEQQQRDLLAEGQRPAIASAMKQRAIVR